jgi:DNA-binding LacI/PurR family transcriptional regulator
VAMRRHGLGELTRILPGGLTEEAGATAARTLLSGADPRPTAVVAFNDRCAVGVLDTVTRAGVAVPTDLSLVGYDDDRLSRLPHVNLTTVAQDAPRMAALAVDTAVALLDGAGVVDHAVVIAPHLTVRGTTGPAAPVSASSGPARRGRA